MPTILDLDHANTAAESVALRPLTTPAFPASVVVVAEGLSVPEMAATAGGGGAMNFF